MQKLTDNAILLNLIMHRPDMTRCADLGKVETACDKGMLSLSKKLINCPSYKKARNYGVIVRNWLATRTTPSPIGRGTYLVPLTLVNDVMDYLEAAKGTYKTLSEEFLSDYPQVKKEAKEQLGDQYDKSNYPTEEELRESFWIEAHLLDLGTPSKEKLGQALWEDERKKAESLWSGAVEDIQFALRESFRDLVKHLADKLEVGPDGKKKKFKDVSVENINEFITLFKARNITDDKELNKLVLLAKSAMAGVAPADLRESLDVREEVRQQFTKVTTTLDRLLVDAPARQIDFD